MSFYGTRSNNVNERGQRNRTSFRKDSTDRYETNANGNNNNEGSRGIDSYISNYTRSAGNSHRSSLSRSTGGLRMKSNLVGSMTATFEQLNTKDLLPSSGGSALKSPSYTRVESLPPSSQKSSSGNKLENGIDHPQKLNNDSSQKLDNGIDRKIENVNDDGPSISNGAEENSERTSSQRSAKPSSSARRGKQQREKRMLRQKRRSTGVVRLKGSDDEDEEKASEKSQNSTEKEKEVTRKLETEKNTLSNELSPPPSAHDVRSENEIKSRSNEVVDPSSSTKQYSTSSSSLLSPSQPDSVFLSGESAPQSPNVPSLNSSRRRGKRTSDLSQQDNKEEMEELRRKLAAAEATIGNLTKEIEEMETDIKQLAEENHNLKHENKLLEDENSSMLMVLKQLRNRD